MKPRIKIITTGGTIVTTKDRETGETTPLLDADEIINTVPELASLASISVEQFVNIPSTEMKLELMLKLAYRIEEAIVKEKFECVIVTHGTDTLEETAYLCELVLGKSITAVFTGAMLLASELSADGPANLCNAVRVAINPKTRGRGQLIVMNNEIHVPRYATKFHTTSLGAFVSLEPGPIGFVREGKIHYHYHVAEEPIIRPSKITAHVELIKITVDPTNTLLMAAIDSGCDGIVIEGTGGGHVPRVLVNVIREAVENGIKVVMVSRCPAGYPLLNTYSIPGGERDLQHLGVIFGRSNGPKTRIFLTLAISAGWTEAMIRDALTFAGK